MRLTRTTPIEADKLSAELMANLGLGESITVHCDNTREYDNSRNNALWARKNKLRPDGYTYEITTSNLNNTVTVKVVEGKL